MTVISRGRRAALLLLLALAYFVGPAGAAKPLIVGSKAFPESWILGDLLVQVIEGAGAEAEHRENLGGTQILFWALESGRIDLYPEYTGTITEVILKEKGRPGPEEVRRKLAARGIGMSDSLGFNNGYALAVSSATAKQRNLRRLSDLAGHPDLRAGLSHEFIGRRDGWPGLSAHYGLRLSSVAGMQHELAYKALETGRIDLVDIYTTDPQIARLGLVLLEDDRDFFPRYEAVLLYRLDLAQREPAALAELLKLRGTIDEQRMIEANAAVAGGARPAEAAGRLRAVQRRQDAPAPAAPSVWNEIARNLGEHVDLVLRSLLAAIAVGVPLGVAASRSGAASALILGGSAAVQTIPSLALLAFFIPVMGIGRAPALAALFLYSLLPIVRNTCTGLTSIPLPLRESADALGLSPWFRLLHVELPLASPSISAGIKTSAVINVGTATLAAFIGAGGLGEPILRGISLLDNSMILSGALPAALLALAVQGACDLLDRLLVPHGLRLKGGERDRP